MLKLGVIGLSPGNGHPYSWAAIFNGYDPGLIEACGFPAIPRYLEQREFPREQIGEAQVTHVWAQDANVASHIAETTFIPHVVDRFTDMIGAVDAILLARDDAENHEAFATPFLHAGLPIYIDKPLSLTVRNANRLLEKQVYAGQLFSCSALRYAAEMRLSQSDRDSIGSILHVQATAPKDWPRYAIHVIEPLLMVIGAEREILRANRCSSGNVTTLFVEFDGNVSAVVTTTGPAMAQLSLKVIGELGSKELVFSDSFSAFKAALLDFVSGVIARDVRADPAFLLKTISIVESGLAE